jgi:hypothetical protein
MTNEYTFNNNNTDTIIYDSNELNIFLDLSQFQSIIHLQSKRLAR